jgi:protein phosphatase
VITTQAIRDTLRDCGDPDQAGQRLIEAANAAGGPDNVSCVVADIVPLG